MDIRLPLQRYLRTGLLFLFLFSIVLTPFNQHGQVQTAEAQRAVVVVGGKGTIEQTINAAAALAIQAFQESLWYKEYFLDGIYYGIAKMVLQSMTQSIVNWINSGFEGKPAFITDLESFLTNRADELAGDFIYNNPSLNFLCSPFRLDVRVALSTSYLEQTRGDSSVQCTLSDVSDNVEGFLSGNFQDGGWPAWFEVTQNPQNTPTGAYLAAESELAARIADDRGRTVEELAWGEGFMSFKVCDGSRGAGGPTEDCAITTPGAVIANQINKSLGAGQDTLIAADEFDEIIGALFAQLAQQAITGLNGLLGLGGNPNQNYTNLNSSNQSYLDALLEEDIRADSPFGNTPAARALASEEEYLALQQGIIDSIDSAEARIASLNEQYANSNCSINVPTPSALVSERTQAEATVLESETNIATLETINQNYASAQDAKEQQTAIQPFTELMSNQQLKSAVDVTQLEYRIENDIDPLLANFNNQIDQAAQNCTGNTTGR